MFNQQKRKQAPSALPLAEKQDSNAADDSDVSVYNSKASTPTTTLFSDPSSGFSEKVISEDSDQQQSNLKRLHKHSKSTLPYAEDNSNSSSYSSQSKKKNQLVPRGFTSAFSLVKQALTESGNKSFGIVILILVAFLLFTDPSFTSFFGIKHRPIEGLSSDVVHVTSPFIIPEVGKFWHDKGSSSSSDLGSSNADGPKKAPGDYGKDLTDEKAPHGMGAGLGVGMAAGMGGAAAGSLTSTEKAVKDALDKMGSKDSAVDQGFRKKSVAAMVYKDSAPSPAVVLVLSLNPEKLKQEYMEKVIDNRRKYAERHGYGLYVRYATDFKEQWAGSVSGKSSWAKLAITRAAIHAFPKAKHFWYLDHNGVIANMDVDIVEQIISPPALKSMMLRDIPVVQSSKVIRTYKNTPAEKVRFIVSQDDIGLSPSSFILCNNDLDQADFSKAFLDYWNDPLCHTYTAFDRSEASALNHVIQWHPVFLSRTAVIASRVLGAIWAPTSVTVTPSDYQNGDFVAIVPSCAEVSSLSCMKDFSAIVPSQ